MNGDGTTDERPHKGMKAPISGAPRHASSVVPSPFIGSAYFTSIGPTSLPKGMSFLMGLPKGAYWGHWIDDSEVLHVAPYAYPSLLNNQIISSSTAPSSPMPVVAILAALQPLLRPPTGLSPSGPLGLQKSPSLGVGTLLHTGFRFCHLFLENLRFSTTSPFLTLAGQPEVSTYPYRISAGAVTR